MLKYPENNRKSRKKYTKSRKMLGNLEKWHKILENARKSKEMSQYLEKC